MSEPLNLDHLPDVETFRNTIMVSPSLSEEQKEEIAASVLLLHRYFHIKPGIKIYQWRQSPPGQHATSDGEQIFNAYMIDFGNSSYGLDLYGAWQFGVQVRTFASCPGFEELISTIQSNPRKIADAMFEAEMALLCKNAFAGRDFKFNQLYQIKGSLRKPDFEFTSSLGRIIVECKRLHYTELQLNRRSTGLQDRLTEKIKQLGLDKTHRVEVKLTGRFPGIESFVTNFEKQVATHGLSSDFSYDEGENEIWIGAQTSPLRFTGGFLARLSMQTVDDVPTKVDVNAAYCVLVVPEEEYTQLTRKLGDLINEANEQIPQDHMGLIFIQTPQPKALAEAWNRKDLSRDYTNILAVGSCHINQGVTLHHRTTDADKIQQLLAARVAAE